jgi:acyl-CoA thioesterase I
MFLKVNTQHIMIFALTLQVFFNSAFANEKLVIMGSSTAAGVGATSVDYSWAGILKKWAAKNKQWTTENLATPGALTQEIICTSPISKTQKAFRLNAKYIILSYPSNDAVEGVPVSQTIENIKSVKRCAVDRGIAVAVMSSLPRENLSLPQKIAIEKTDEALKVEMGDCFIDTKDTLNGFDRMSLSAGDGIHFNNNGHWEIFNTVKTFINDKKCFK